MNQGGRDRPLSLSSPRLWLGALNIGDPHRRWLLGRSTASCHGSLESCFYTPIWDPSVGPGLGNLPLGLVFPQLLPGPSAWVLPE